MDELSLRNVARGCLRPFLETGTLATSIEPASLDAVKAKELETILEAYQYIEGRLNRAHAAGDYLTTADTFLYIFCR